MFALRGVTISASVFFLVYVFLSLAVSLLWAKIADYSRNLLPRSLSRLLFAVRMLPLAGAAVLTAAFTVPSFVLLEPRAIEEPFGILPLALGICGLTLAAFGATNALTALVRASRMIEHWTRQAVNLESEISIPVWRIDRVVPALAAAGILRPRVLLSGAAEFVLNSSELQTALRHELAHVRRRDNLKKLLLRCVAFPKMRTLETAWLEATEMAADDAAVSSATEALDLAAALIKLSKLSANHGRRANSRSNELMTAFVHCSASLTNARVERLIAWSAERPAPRRYPLLFSAGLLLAVAATFAVTYSHLLAQVHTATEWLVR